MKTGANVSAAEEIMVEFARLTGLSPAGNAPRRYLWTDAFAVCNLLGLYRQTGSEKWRELALMLVDQVHSILGRHREDDLRKGWISGLHEDEGRMHPTKGGLRIGKEMNERRPHEPFDESLEWDRDGQYFHYLTRWIHALSAVALVTEDPVTCRGAVELAEAAHSGFTYLPPGGGRKRMYWKMSIDLSRPLVASMGHHDPLDGLVTFLELRAIASGLSPGLLRSALEREIADFEDMGRGINWATEDPLGLGGLLVDAFKVGRMMVQGALAGSELLATLLDAAEQGLRTCAGTGLWRLSAQYRLAFRELGLAIGLKAVLRLQRLMKKEYDTFKDRPHLLKQIEGLKRYAPLMETIEAFWLEDSHREVASWQEHREINMVMLATSLAPEGYLALLPSAPPTAPAVLNAEARNGGSGDSVTISRKTTC